MHAVGDEESDRDDEPAVRWFPAMPVAKLVVFGVVGGWLYLAYWMYENWKAYRAAWGYSSKAAATPMTTKIAPRRARPELAYSTVTTFARFLG